MEPETSAEPYWRHGHLRFDVAACKNSLRQHVRPGLLVQQRRILSDGDLGIDHGFEQIVGDLDPSDRVLGEVTVLAQNCHDRLADIADLVARQRKQLRRVVVLHPRRCTHRLDQIIEIMRGVNGEDALHLDRYGCIDTRGQGMRMITAS